ncbi:MAG: NOG1 family protein [Candidatus Hodarchaeota archaeon]
MNPFADFKSVRSSEEILETAIRRASKVKTSFSPRQSKISRIKKEEVRKVRVLAQNLIGPLNKVIKQMPTLSNIDPFYQELTEILVGIDKLRKTLASLSGSTRVIKNIADQHIRKIRKTRDLSVITSERKAAYGRIASVMKKLQGRMIFLKDAFRRLRGLPSTDPSVLTIAVGGPPNVGKSTFVKAVSTAKPEIAAYPFTTRELIVGHIELDKQRVQIIDLPGLLDRPLGKRNAIELQAITALKHLANVIIFIIDPSETSGYPLDNQLSLFHEIETTFDKIPIIPVINKTDLASHQQIKSVKERMGGISEMVATKGIGVRKLLQRTFEVLNLSKEQQTQTKSKRDNLD